jgi:glycogen operon protein
MVRTAPPPEKDTVLLVINGSLDAVHLILADDHGGRWRLAWDSVWESPAEERAAAIEGSLHAEPGEATVVEALSMRVYVLD